jgi:RNA polymerase sigma factor for flagellar operon FliA
VTARQQRDALILAHLHLVRHTVSRIVAQLPPGIDLENLESAGTLGLVEAATKFDPGRGVKFETFAAYRIRGAVFDELRRNCLLPQHLLDRVALIRRAYQELPPPVTLEALAQKTGLTPDEVTDCLAALRMSRMVSWEYLADVKNVQVAAEPSEAPGEMEDQKRLLAQGIARLAERERLVVTLYYLEEMRLKEIGQVLQLSESRISRLLSGAIYNLGEWMRENGAA